MGRFELPNVSRSARHPNSLDAALIFIGWYHGFEAMSGPLTGLVCDRISSDHGDIIKPADFDSGPVT
jgi:hypothetical protein